MTTRNKRKLAALNEENCEEHPRSNLLQNSSTPRSQEDYITQVSEEIEGRVTKRLSKEFSRTKNYILGALARLDNFLMNSLLPGGSGTTPEPSRNALSISQGTNEDDSQSDPHPEAGLFHGQMTQNFGPGDGHYRGGKPIISYHYTLLKILDTKVETNNTKRFERFFLLQFQFLCSILIFVISKLLECLKASIRFIFSENLTFKNALISLFLFFLPRISIRTNNPLFDI